MHRLHPAAVLLTPAEMAEADRLTIAGGVSGYALMERAGAAVAEAACAMAGKRIVILCGPGNNGGDGYVAARLLAADGRPVVVAALGEPSALKGDAAKARQDWTGAVIDAEHLALHADDLVIDALFGAGLDRPLEGAAKRLVDAVNMSGATVLAVDLPSGLDGGTGAVLGAAIRAQRTVTFFRAKPGHWLYPGRGCCGTVMVADIRIGTAVFDRIGPKTLLNAPTLWRDALKPAADGHKYSRGHVVVIAGEGVGAARLAARTALRGGAGLVTLFTPEATLAAHQARGPDALMVRPFGGTGDLLRQLGDHRYGVLVVGPAFGLGGDRLEMLAELISLGRNMVLDADALTLIAQRPAMLDALPPGHAVLTPHEGEFRRLLPDAQGAKPSRARMAANRLGQIVLLKGADTVIAAPDGVTIINGNAPPWLATAGSGDVLAGLVAAILAQGLLPLHAAAAAAWLHGEAANQAGRGLIADDLPDALPRVWPLL